MSLLMRDIWPCGYSTAGSIKSTAPFGCVLRPLDVASPSIIGAARPVGDWYRDRRSRRLGEPVMVVHQEPDRQHHQDHERVHGCVLSA
jgi:hypothetical protein